jgi:protein-S-isoprenylcysteine O-methyltransferase Ste14
MEQPTEKFTTPLSLVVDLVLMVLFFAFLFSVLRSHVPSTNPTMIIVWAGLAASCLTGVFWLALQMFRVVFRAYRAANK